MNDKIGGLRRKMDQQAEKLFSGFATAKFNELAKRYEVATGLALSWGHYLNREMLEQEIDRILTDGRELDSDIRFDLDWLDGVADGASGNILSVGRAQRISKHIKELEKRDEL